jgi:predicted HicB family RNase H-like nuclease
VGFNKINYESMNYTDTLTYKGITAEFEKDSEGYAGKVINLPKNEGILFQADSLYELCEYFKEAVDEYLNEEK